MTQLILKAVSLKPKAESRKITITSLFSINASYLWFSAYSFFLVTSIVTKMKLLWRRSIQIRFSMASPLLYKIQAFSCRLSALGFLLLAFNISTHAQNPPAIDTTVAATDSANVYYDDSSKIDSKVESIVGNGDVDTPKINSKGIMASIVLLSEDSIKSLRNNSGFSYMAYLDSLLKAKEIEKKKKPMPKRESYGVSFWDIGVIRLLCWAVAIGVVAFVLYKLFLGKGNAFARNAKNNIPQVQMDEEPDMDDLDGQLKKAVQNGNYRLATRYLFLKTLQQLADKNAIALSTEKTNIQYSQELRGKTYADGFARLCLSYEYVWFGEFHINAEQFASIQQQQQQLVKAI